MILMIAASGLPYSDTGSFPAIEPDAKLTDRIVEIVCGELKLRRPQVTLSETAIITETTAVTIIRHRNKPVVMVKHLRNPVSIETW